MTLGFIFAGQGQQFLYMGQDLAQEYPSAKKIYDEASEILGYDLLTLDAEKLQTTRYTQPALFTLSYVITKLLEENDITASMLAGLSLGEYNALCASSVFDFETGLNIIKQRAILMESAFEPHTTGMLACLKTDKKTVSNLLKDTGVELCNINTPSQIVVGGKKEDIEKVQGILKENKVRAIPLKVSTVSHMSLLKPASLKLESILKTVQFNKPQIPFINNVEASFQTEGFEDSLSRQIAETTLMADSIQLMIDEGVTHIIEIGPKKTIIKFIKEIDPSIQTQNIFDASTLKEGLSWIKESQL